MLLHNHYLVPLLLLNRIYCVFSGCRYQAGQIGEGIQTARLLARAGHSPADTASVLSQALGGKAQTSVEPRVSCPVWSSPVCPQWLSSLGWKSVSRYSSFLLRELTASSRSVGACVRGVRERRGLPTTPTPGPSPEATGDDQVGDSLTRGQVLTQGKAGLRF